MHRLLPICLIAATLSVSWMARANPGSKPAAGPGAPTAATKPLDHADELFEQAVTAYDAGRFADAEAKLAQAWAIKRTHDIAGNLGVVELKLGKYPEAATHLAWALQHFPPTEADQARQGFQRDAAKARAQSGTLHIQVSVAGADVSVNGLSVGTSPLAEDIYIAPGNANVVARLDGYMLAQQAVEVAKGEARDVSLSLVLSGGKPKGRSLVPVVVLGGAAGAALVTGIVLLVRGAAKRGDARTGYEAITNAHHSCVDNAANYDASCPALNDTALSAGTFHNAGVGVLVGAGALAAGAAAYFLWPASTPTKPSALRILPTTSTTSAGLLFSGSF